MARSATSARRPVPSCTTRPARSFTGDVKVYYTVTDTVRGTSAPGFVTISVLPTIRANDDGPLAAEAGVPLLIPASQILANDVSPDGLPPTIKSVQDAVNGTVVLNADGSVTFVPAGPGPASFTYTATDSAHDPEYDCDSDLERHRGTGASADSDSDPRERALDHDRTGKKRKITGAEIVFSGALDFGTAQNTGNYHVTQKISKKKTKAIPVLVASYNMNNDSVTLLLGPSKAGAAMQLTIAGLFGSNGEPLATSIIEL